MRVGSTTRPRTLPNSAARRGSWKPPYELPNAGEVVSISTNLPSDIKPSTHTAAEWDYALFGSFGGGSLVEDYSVGGAYVIAGSGGHSVPPNIGAAIFDFADGTWKRKDNANGIDWQATDYLAAEISNDNPPAGELIAADIAGMPAPSHLYAFCEQLRSSQGGGPNGSLMTLRGVGMGVDANRGSTYAHAFDLSTGLWRRVSTNGSPVLTILRPRASCYDAAAGIYFMPNSDLGDGELMDYLVESSWTWNTLWFTPPSQAGDAYTAFIDQARRVMVVVTDSPVVRAMDLDDMPSGVTTLNITGTPETPKDRYHYYPADDCYYTFSGYSTHATLHKIKPPPIGTDPLTGTWACSDVTVNTALRQEPQIYIDAGAWGQTRFTFVPSIGCFAWIPGGDYPVQILRPPA